MSCCDKALLLKVVVVCVILFLLIWCWTSVEVYYNPAFANYSLSDALLINTILILPVLFVVGSYILVYFEKLTEGIIGTYVPYKLTYHPQNAISLNDYRKLFEDKECCIRIRLSKKKIIDTLMNFYKLDSKDYNKLVKLHDFTLKDIYKIHIVLLDLQKKGVDISKLNLDYLKIYECEYSTRLRPEKLFKIISKDKVLNAFKKKSEFK